MTGNWGKLIGAALGLWLWGWPGVILGLLLGHLFDRRRSPPGGWRMGVDAGAVQRVFFDATFSVMGHVAKSDGRVSESEILLAKQVMRNMGLTGDQMRLAQDLFNTGKQPGFSVDRKIADLLAVCRGQRNLLQLFLEIQIATAMADNELHPRESALLTELGRHLGFRESHIQLLLKMVSAQQRYTGANEGTPHPSSLEDAYGVLGVSSNSTDQEIKKAYRKLLSEHHPDKLVSRGLPAEMMQIATEKTREIRSAYEEIKRARAMK